MALQADGVRVREDEHREVDFIDPARPCARPRDRIGDVEARGQRSESPSVQPAKIGCMECSLRGGGGSAKSIELELDLSLKHTEGIPFAKLELLEGREGKGQ